jgi:hypothetical protein
MLGKLMKYEFLATGRVMLPLFILLAALAVLTNLTTRLMQSTEQTVLNVIGVITLVLFVFAIFAVAIMSLVLMIQRFFKNLLTDEGYLMFTLPTSVHNLVWSKLIVSAIWFIATALVIALSILIAAFDVSVMSEISRFFRQFFHGIASEYALNGAAILVEMIVVVFLSCAATCLLFYSAMSLGYSFDGHKALLSVVFIIVFYVVIQLLNTLFLFAVNDFDANWRFSTMTTVHLFMGITILLELIYCAIFYVVTVLSLKKRLNLE